MQRIDDLECKGLKIIQDSELYNFTIDSILLVNLSKVKSGGTVVDLCSGSGIIPILVSAKSKAKMIYGIEIQKELCKNASESIMLNNLKNVQIINDDIANYKKYFKNGTVDIVYCNPPYFKSDENFISNNESRAIARCELKTNLESVIFVASSLLKFNGTFYLVHQIKRLQEIMALLKTYNLAVKNVVICQSTKNEKPHLVIIKAIKGGGMQCNDFSFLVLNNSDGTLTDEVKALYSKLEI